MILTAAEAREIGEALLDAAENSHETKTDQSVVILGKQTVVALPSDTLVDEWEHFARITSS